ncbi:hypothetical protein [Magnetofaba australis]|nr:hypothetical protein [Magnetofaba australis]
MVYDYLYASCVKNAGVTQEPTTDPDTGALTCPAGFVLNTNGSACIEGGDAEMATCPSGTTKVIDGAKYSCVANGTEDKGCDYSTQFWDGTQCQTVTKAEFDASKLGSASGTSGGSTDGSTSGTSVDPNAARDGIISGLGSRTSTAKTNYDTVVTDFKHNATALLLPTTNTSNTTLPCFTIPVPGDQSVSICFEPYRQWFELLGTLVLLGAFIQAAFIVIR